MQKEIAFDQLPQEEQIQKLAQITKLLKKYGLDKAKASILGQIVCTIKQGMVQKQGAMMVEGTFGTDMAPTINKFNKEAYSTILKGINKKTATLQLSAKLAVGDPFAPLSEVINIKTGDEENVEHKSGQVMLIDFWATWCPPCQEPMKHNQQMLEKNGSRWGDKVRIIGVSIDDTVEAVVKHVKAKGWGKVEHYHRAGSTASQDYGVKGVPQVVLIDTEGKIAFTGHPAARKLEDDIETLLKGQKLKGSGVQPGLTADKEDEEEARGFQELDLEKIKKEMDLFAVKLGQLVKSKQISDIARYMQKDMIVCVKTIKYDLESEKILTKYENINVLVGPMQCVEILKKEIDSFLSSLGCSFKTDYRIQAF